MMKDLLGSRLSCTRKEREDEIDCMYSSKIMMSVILPQYFCPQTPTISLVRDVHVQPSSLCTLHLVYDGHQLDDQRDGQVCLEEAHEELLLDERLLEERLLPTFLVRQLA
jgi:hypothetical protein